MPVRNVIKTQVPNSYYHVYTRGNNKQLIFRDENDHCYFYNLVCRYLSNDASHEIGRVYPNFGEDIEILSYCIMPNHIHFLIYQKDIPYLEKFMRSLMTSYGMYFNLKYKQSGPVFESRYKATLIDDEVYLLHISRYIHLNPRRWKKYEHSSLKYYYRKLHKPDWINTSKILSQFSSAEEYLNFVADYEEMRDSLKEIKHLIVK